MSGDCVEGLTCSFCEAKRLSGVITGSGFSLVLGSASTAIGPLSSDAWCPKDGGSLGLVTAFGSIIMAELFGIVTVGGAI